MRGNIGAEIDVIKPALPAQTHAPIAIHFAFRVSRTSFLAAVSFRMILMRARGPVTVCCRAVFRYDLYARTRAVDGILTVLRSFLFFYGHSCSQLCEASRFVSRARR